MINIGIQCKTARKEAGISQEAAAERLYTSTTTLAAIERGEREPQPELIKHMAELYENSMLQWQYIRFISLRAGLAIFSSDMEKQPLVLSVLQLANRIFEFADQHKDRRLMHIAEDGIIDEKERPEFDAIVNDLNQIMQLAMELRCW